VYSLQELRWMIDEESTSYVVQHKIDPNEIEDSYGRLLVKEAAQALNSLEEYLWENTEEYNEFTE
jgi:hypothetical protein